MINGFPKKHGIFFVKINYFLKAHEIFILENDFSKNPWNFFP